MAYRRPFSDSNLSTNYYAIIYPFDGTVECAIYISISVTDSDSNRRPYGDTLRGPNDCTNISDSYYESPYFSAFPTTIYPAQ